MNVEFTFMNVEFTFKNVEFTYINVGPHKHVMDLIQYWHKLLTYREATIETRKQYLFAYDNPLPQI